MADLAGSQAILDHLQQRDALRMISSTSRIGTVQSGSPSDGFSHASTTSMCGSSSSFGTVTATSAVESLL